MAEREPENSEDDMSDDKEVLDLTNISTDTDKDNTQGSLTPSFSSSIQTRSRASPKKGDSPKKKKGKGGRRKR